MVLLSQNEQLCFWPFNRRTILLSVMLMTLSLAWLHIILAGSLSNDGTQTSVQCTLIITAHQISVLCPMDMSHLQNYEEMANLFFSGKTLFSYLHEVSSDFETFQFSSYQKVAKEP